MADGNNDLSVTLQEVGRYLEDHVTAEVAPVSQVPMVLGNRNERMAKVDYKLLSALLSGKTSQMQMFSPIETRGMEDDVLAGVDTTTRDLYRLFKKALKEKVFLEPVNACAETYFNQLIQEPKFERLHSTMKRNYAAALQDDAQQTLNKVMKSDLKEILSSGATEINKYKLYIRHLEKASTLLGQKHYMYPILQGRQEHFKGYLMVSESHNDVKLGIKALEQLRSSLIWQPDQPLVYLDMSSVFGIVLGEPDSAKYYDLLAASLAPTWLLPYTHLSNILCRYKGRLDEAKILLDKALTIDSNAAVVWYFLGIWHAFNSRTDYLAAENCFNKSILLDPTVQSTYYYLACVLNEQNKIDAAYNQLELAINKGYKQYDKFQQDMRLENMRQNSERWKTLMKKHFPDKIKE
ncbi:MAG TPA: hypothetical protein PK209_09310 [Saprospiraceae bacterium]|nr:hypothetical protein [Saprospiraceae bacterium]